MKPSALLVLLLCCLAATGCEASLLPLCEAKAIVQGVIDWILTFDPTTRSNIVVLDAGANVILSARMDGAINLVDTFATMKAMTAITLGFPSGATILNNGSIDTSTSRCPLFDPGQPLFKIDEHLKMSGLGGAFPLYRNGSLVGALGVSGAPTAAGDVSAALAGYQITDCITSITVNATLLPRLWDALHRTALVEASAASKAQPETVTVCDDLGRITSFVRMDGAALIAVSLGILKARTSALTGVATDLLQSLKVFEPFHSGFTGDNSNGGLVAVPGGIPISNTNGDVVGAIGTSGAMNPMVDVEIAEDGVNGLPAAFSSTPMLPLANAYAALQSALNTAQAMNLSATVAIADADGQLKLLYAMDGSAPCGVAQSTRKAFSAVALPLNPAYLPGILYAPPNGMVYNLAAASGGLVLYSGFGAIRDVSGNVLGGVGVFTDGTTSQDNAIAAAAVAASVTALPPTSFVPPKSSYANSGAYRSPEHHTDVMHEACWEGFSRTNSSGSCAARNLRGALSVFVAQNKASRIGPDIASRLSDFSYSFPHSSGGVVQQALNPINGSHFTASNAAADGLVAVGGGTPLLDPFGFVVGSLGFHFNSESPDATAIIAAAASSYFSDELIAMPSCIKSVQQYWEGLAAGNFTAALSNVDPNVTFSWPGDVALLPMAGTRFGRDGIVSFFAAVGEYFDFAFCGNAGPVLSAAAGQPSLVFAFWQECSTLKGSATVPCPNNLNQAQYQCDAASGLIRSVAVALDNLCVANALCNGSKALTCAAPMTASPVSPSTGAPSPTGTTSAPSPPGTNSPTTASPSTPAPVFNAPVKLDLSVGTFAGSCAASFTVALIIGLIIGKRCCGGSRRHDELYGVSMNQTS